MSNLPTNLRRQLENAIKQARRIAEGGARKALEAIAVHEPDPYRHMDETQLDLGSKLRAQAKQLGDGESQSQRGAYEIKHLVEKLAYDQWRRLLFARFLLENNLLISPEHGVSVSLDDCEELAPSAGLKDAWAVAARFAAKELPEIFRADDPAGAVELPVENRRPLIQHVTGLPVEVFTASDSLGWCYQFWQAERKDEVNATGNKIGADELPAVTQLFTEDYMVDFLLDNTLGAWHAGKVLAAKSALAETAQSEDELRNAVALRECPWKYLRFIKGEDGKWTPAAGTFDGWPKFAKELKCLDPCMGSGHFAVAIFERLVALRMSEEAQDEAASVQAVIRDNLFGLELDQRCTQIGAFNLALAAWRRVGHCKLPAMNIACSGLAPNAKKEDWLKLAGNNNRLQNGMDSLYQLFMDAPVLGSLINPRGGEGDLLEAAFHELQPLLEKALAQETENDAAHEMVVTARGLAKAAEILASQFTLVATNVPYLGRGKQDEVLMSYCERVHPEAKADLATCFIERSLSFCTTRGSTALVTPQNWWFLGSFKQLRNRLLTTKCLNAIATLGEEAWQSFGDRGPVAALIVISSDPPSGANSMIALDALPKRTIKEKITELIEGQALLLLQADQQKNPDFRLTIERTAGGTLLAYLAESHHGLTTGDSERMQRQFWESNRFHTGWIPFCTAPNACIEFSGRSRMLLWNGGTGTIDELLGARKDGQGAWGKVGVLVRQMRELSPTIHSGNAFDNNTAAIVPHKPENLLAIWAYTSSPEYQQAVRRIDRKVSVTSATLVKVPFDLAHWQKVAAKKYPRGLPKPFSSDPTQWLFNGHPKGSDQPLHVAVVRLLGYLWPRQTGSSFPDCPAPGPDGLEKPANNDGIVCLSATKGEAPGAERLWGLLTQALGKFDLGALIASAGPKGSKSETLEAWLRDEFFEQHCAVFHHRPVVWHIWDGQTNGFSALVNYHRLTHANLEKLTYAYLGDWIRRQQAAVDTGEGGSDARLQAAKQLQSRLKFILEGEPPYDIFVRWKPLSKQTIGWQPDIDDGVRMNIRPFAVADILRKRVKIKWDKDRGNEPYRDKKEFPWFWGWDENSQDFAGIGKEPDGNRWNDCHCTNDFKREARKPR